MAESKPRAKKSTTRAPASPTPATANTPGGAPETANVIDTLGGAGAAAATNGAAGSPGGATVTAQRAPGDSNPGQSTAAQSDSGQPTPDQLLTETVLTEQLAANARGGELTPEQRYRMTQEAAYYIAEQRGFTPGDPAEDWARAEAQIDEMLGRG